MIPASALATSSGNVDLGHVFHGPGHALTEELVGVEGVEQPLTGDLRVQSRVLEDDAELLGVGGAPLW
jgi:hypothetical protein